MNMNTIQHYTENPENMNTKKTINVQGVMAMQATNKNLDKDWSEIPQEQQFKNLNMKYINEISIMQKKMIIMKILINGNHAIYGCYASESNCY